MLKVRIIWDVDCVLSDMIPYVCKRIEKDFGKKFTPYEINQWDLREVTGIPEIQSIFDSDMITNQPAMEGALKYLPELWKKTYSTLVTYGVNDTYNEKSKWLQKNYPFINIDGELIFAKKKYLIDGDIFIDDRKENCIKWLERHPNGIAIMLAYEYNNLDIDDWKNDRLMRVNDWEHLNNVVNMLINFVNGCQNYITKNTKEDM